MHLAVVLVALLAAPAAQAQGPAAPERSLVVTSGEGLVEKAPDQAWVTLGVESRASSPREAQDANAKAMAAVQQQLSASVPPDAVRTASYDVQPEYDHRDGKQKLRGYVARNTIEVRVDKLPSLGEIIEKGVAAGATTVGGVRFDLRDRDAVEREALQRAVTDARLRAEAAAAAAGLKIARIVAIEEAGVEPPRPLAMMRESAAADAAPPIAPGTLEVTANVTLTVEIAAR